MSKIEKMKKNYNSLISLIREKEELLEKLEEDCKLDPRTKRIQEIDQFLDTEILKQKVENIRKVMRKKKRSTFTDEEFEIVVLLEPWRRTGKLEAH